MIENGNGKMSQLIWGLSWDEYLPLPLGDYFLEVSSYDDFIKIKSSPNSFLISSDNAEGTFVKDGGSIVKEKYLRHVSDFFVIKKGNEVVGVVICEMREWTSYYLRYIFIHPEHRANNLTVMFVMAIESVLKKFGIDKITCDISPANLGQVARMSKAGYICTGNLLSERFGAMIVLSKYLKEESWRVYNKNFIQMFYGRKPGEMISSVNN